MASLSGTAGRTLARPRAVARGVSRYSANRSRRKYNKVGRGRTMACGETALGTSKAVTSSLVLSLAVGTRIEESHRNEAALDISRGRRLGPSHRCVRRSGDRHVSHQSQDAKVGLLVIASRTYPTMFQSTQRLRWPSLMLLTREGSSDRSNRAHRTGTEITSASGQKSRMA